MTRAIVYARISKDDKKDQLGVGRQEADCRELAERRGLEVVTVFADDDRSAWDRTVVRDSFEALLGALKTGEADALIVYHMDRLARRHGDLERLEEICEAVGFMTYTVESGDFDLATAAGQQQAENAVSAAKGESKRISERTKRKHKELASMGKAPGGRSPYGYRWEFPDRSREKGNYLLNDTEAHALRTMARRILEGASTLAVSRELDAAGITTREGRPWHHSTVRAVLTNPAVAGLRVHRREIAGPGTWEPILDRTLWEQVRATVADPARKRTRPARKHLLSGLVVNTLGETMNGSTVADKPFYVTRSPAERSTQIPALGLEEFVVEAMLQVFDKTTLPTPEQPDNPSGNDITGLEAELAELAALRGSGEISLPEWMAARKPLTERLQAARKAAGTPKRAPREVKLLSVPGAVRQAWPTLDFAQRREILSTVLDRITIGPATKGRWTDLASRVDITWKV